MDRALVTGVTGFVGAHLARHLLGLGVEVHAVIRPGAGLHRIPDLVSLVRFHTDEGDDSLRDAVAAAAPDACFHLATHFVGVHGPGDAGPLVEDNVAFPTRLADILADAGHRRFLNVGSAWQHVGGAPYRPKNLYAATKQAFEDVLRFYDVSGRLDVATVKLYDTYGPLDHRGKVVVALVRAALSGATLEMTSGQQLVDLVHAGDVARALLAVAESGTGGSYALSSGEPRTIRQLVDLVSKVTGRPIDAAWGVRPDRDDEMFEPWQIGAPPPGWAPAIPLADGLAEIVAEQEATGGA